MSLVSPLSSDLERIAKQWLVADRFAEERLGENLDQSPSDIGRLQKLIDLGIFTDKGGSEPRLTRIRFADLCMSGSVRAPLATSAARHGAHLVGMCSGAQQK